jgi:lipoprotein-anchoring transpeptidase ErfK/SrfK
MHRTGDFMGTTWARPILSLAVIALAATALPVAALAAQAAAPTLSLTASPAVCTAGQAVTLSSTIDVPGATLTVSRMRAGEDSFTVVRSITADGAGTASWTPSPLWNTTYRVAYVGDAVWDAAAAETAVSVRPRLTLTAPTWAYSGAPVKFAARVVPVHPGATVELQRRVDGVWTAWQTLTLDQQSRATYRWRPKAVGSSSFRLAMTADADHTDGLGTRVIVKVKDGNPYDIPVRPAHFIVADKSQYRLYYHEHGHIVRVFNCVLGKPSTPTPLGRFRIYAKDPAMSGAYGPRRMRYLGLFAIHGTNEPWLLSRFPRGYSHGCTRLANANILWLYARCPVGTQVWNVP